MSGQFILKPGGKLGILSGFIGEGKVALQGQSRCQPCCDPCEAFPAASDHFSEHFNGLRPEWTVTNPSSGVAFESLSYPGRLHAVVSDDIGIPATPWCAASYVVDGAIRKRLPIVNLLRVGFTYFGRSLAGTPPTNETACLIRPSTLVSDNVNIILQRAGNGLWPVYIAGATGLGFAIQFYQPGFDPVGKPCEAIYRRISGTSWQLELWVDGILRNSASGVTSGHEDIPTYGCNCDQTLLIKWYQAASYYVEYDDVFCEIESS